MKKFRLLFSICIVILSACFGGCSLFANNSHNSIDKIKSQGYITMSTNAEFEPFEYRDGYNIVGIDIDIAKKIAQKLGVKLRVNDVSFDAIIFELKNNICDFSAAGLSYDEDKAKNIDFSKPYFIASQAIIVLNDSSIKSKDDLYNKKIGVHLGTTGDRYCTNMQDVTVVRFLRGSDAVLDLLNNQIDAIVIDDFAANKLVDKNNEHIKKLDEPLTNEEYRLAVDKGNTQLVTFLNNCIDELLQSGELDMIIEKYSNE